MHSAKSNQSLRAWSAQRRDWVREEVSEVILACISRLIAALPRVFAED
jgi:hypothetical protein